MSSVMMSYSLLLRFAPFAHPDASTGDPGIRPEAGDWRLVEDEIVLAVPDDAVPPADAGGVGHDPEDRGGASAAKLAKPVQKSRDGACEQHNKNEKN